MKISAIILTKNEEKKIERVVSSLGFCDEVLVIDDISTDGTSIKAKNAGANVFLHTLNNDFAAQRNWAMKQAYNEWILFIDADEEVSSHLAKEIMTVLDDKTAEVVAFSLPRVDYFWGTEMKHGETRKARTNGIIRLVKKGNGTWAGAVHETFVPTGTVAQLHCPIRHYSHDSLSSFVRDINTYSTLRARELSKAGRKVSVFELIFFPFGKFLYTYFVLGGFLDGAAGFVYSFVMSFHSFLVRAKLVTASYV